MLYVIKSQFEVLLNIHVNKTQVYRSINFTNTDICLSMYTCIFYMLINVDILFNMCSNVNYQRKVSTVH